MSELPGERDRNFLLDGPDGRRYVLKLAHADEPAGLLALQHRVLERLAERAPELLTPRLLPSRNGAELELVRSEEGTEHLVRVLSWVPGRELAGLSYQSPELLESLGTALACFDRALAGWHPPEAVRDLKWDLTRAGWIRNHLHRIPNPRRGLVERQLERFETEVVPALPRLRRAVIHNDANDWNVIVGPGGPYERRVVALLDLGDLLESVLVADLAIGCAYAMQGKRDPLAAAGHVVAGYQAVYPLHEHELELLVPLIGTRLAVSVVNSAEQREAFPEDAYLHVSEADAWRTLERLDRIHPRLAHYQLRAAAGLPPCPNAAPVVAWLRNRRDEIGPLLGIEGAVAPLDLSVGSPLLETPLEPDDLPAFSAKLCRELTRAGARIGVGRYNEARLLYGTAGYHAEGNERDVPRTVHLGLDLFAEPGTPVQAPLAGSVHSVRDNGMDRDYGPTVILRHEPPGGSVFYTLYGHLGREVIGALLPGAMLPRGRAFATIGAADVNGGWPPHLHFQLSTDLLDRDGEFPGVARADQRALWQSLSPDPNLVARLPDELVAPAHRSPAGILAARREHLGPSLSLSYRRPLTIVRGWKQWLYDEAGLRYLDCVNNVAHVGHSHPRVVQAIREQAAVLNTNTRYLHERLVEYAERLTALFPPPLSVCYLVNSGSEANELALRLARAATGRRGVVVLAAGYHGNTTTLVDVSPYKHAGPGGSGAPSWVRTVALPASGLERAGATRLAPAIDSLTAAGEPPAAFLAEAIPSCAGQVVLPDGFLAGAYAEIRAAGGLAIADEVQTGLGRVGTHWWGFETQQVVPDIVTLGKPIGNGHPLGAVVTTPEIARAFASGMEYFSTFGGNPVSCAAGLAVLDVLAAENLREQAREVGSYLLTGLRGLVARHALAGEARGFGLFLGLELVRERGSREPAGVEAAAIANRMQERGILLSTDGPHHNVLKLKPPLCFTRQDADQLLDSLDQVLGEDFQ